MEPTTMTDVHTAWLVAGANDDVATMRQLWSQFPEWLDFHRQVRSATQDSPSQRQARFCSWSDFHLRTVGASALHTAAWGGNIGIAEFLLESGQSPDEQDDNGMTAMMVAILRLNLLTMRCVFRNGEAVRRNTVVDCREEQDKRLSLVIAVIKLLLRFGADVDVQSQDGKTALHYATGDDAYEVAKVLLDAGANIDALDESGKTSLHYCVQEGGLLVTNLLLSQGANIDLEDNDGETSLTLMVQKENVSVLQVFLNHHQLVATPQRNDFAAEVLFQAVNSGKEEVVLYVVENEYSTVTVQNDKGETPFHRAILRRSPSLMELLADLDPAGDNLTAITTEPKTPAHYAATHGSSREVEVLLQCLTSVFGDLEELGLDNPLNAVDGHGMTSLYIVGTYSSRSRRSISRSGLWGAISAADHDVRDAKAQLLLHHGARLLPLDFLAQNLAVADSSNGEEGAFITFPVQVRRCLQNWLVEDGARRVDPEEPENEETAHANPADNLVEALTDLCVQWMSSAVCVGSRASLLPILICAGYAHEIVPLLVELSVQRSALPTLLRQLEKFARHQLCHPLLLQLHNELLEASQARSTH